MRAGSQQPIRKWYYFIHLILSLHELIFIVIICCNRVAWSCLMEKEASCIWPTLSLDEDSDIRLQSLGEKKSFYFETVTGSCVS